MQTVENSDVHTPDADENKSRLSDGDECEENHMDEFIIVRLADIRKEVQCPICLGIIRKTRTVMECLHRFCRECIDKSMRMGNNECPACRTHCASRRSLRDDPNYDALIAAIYPDIDQYEEEEMSFQEVEKVRNKQIQAEIAQTFCRQTKALSKKRKRSQKTYRRRRVNSRSEEEANGDDSGQDPSSTDEHCVEVRSKRLKQWRGKPSPRATSGGGDSSDQEVVKEPMVASVGLVIGSAEMLAWGKGGIRSNSRNGSGAGGTVKHSRSRIERLSDHLRSLSETDNNEKEIEVALFSFDERKQSVVHHSFLSVKPTLSVAQLNQFISLRTSLPPESIEILAMKGPQPDPMTLELCKDYFQVLINSEETFGRLRDAISASYLMLAFRQKVIP